MANTMWVLLLTVGVLLFHSATAQNCTIPQVMRDQWYSFENGENTITELDAVRMSGRGRCVELDQDSYRYTMLFRRDNCYFCVQLLVRTINVMEKRETACQNFPNSFQPTLKQVCKNLDPEQDLITMFNENYRPKICRSSLEGTWHFSYQNRFRFTGECAHKDNRLTSCQELGNQFLFANQKFTLNYAEQCGNPSPETDPIYSLRDVSQGPVEFACLGDWKVGKDHFFAVANTKESRKEEKYRCFLKNRDDDLLLGKSITPECNVLKTPQDSPERLNLTPVKSETVTPLCNLPTNFSGEWVNTANTDADVVINSTHVIETYYPDEGRYRRTVYTCLEKQGNRFMMARQNIDGCQTDYVCFDFLPRHHNVIRFRRGRELIQSEFHTVCAWKQFEGSDGVKQIGADGSWLYNIMVAKKPVPIGCPVAGMFKFDQLGEIKFRTRILHGITDSPRPDLKCQYVISEFAACHQGQKAQTEISIDNEKCYSVDYLGRPHDIYSDPDYKMQCVGFWRENLRSYLITYDELDPISKYRCWVYIRTDINRIKMSQAVGSFCNINQRADSSNYTEGAAVFLDLRENERERDRCPLYFDDGENPWEKKDQYFKVFDFKYNSGARLAPAATVLLSWLTAVAALL
ncbi:uncharacterized protein LOC122386877 [Amphibalanus amphitrite]|uniref:uncharacterized protein LOC122386877 n=1 Tax=Amphibalanus amphitrite TaxID=1232801 RepID=UPI001C91B5C8|nr:uncharacterized protein LOC122386877 [Amphibalanus amphitrite]XP_043232503.1 uncharacterized protein LOC122386877 [Amphibalanus amphitrite]